MDDEAFFAQTLAEGLSVEFPNCSIHDARDGREALTCLERHPIDVLITDLKMPRYDGFSLLAELISRKIHVPTIVLSAFGSPENSLQAERLGALAILDKPIELDEVVRVVKRAFSARQAGSLQGVTLAGFLQLLELERRSCMINVNVFGVLSRIFVQDGAVKGAWSGERRGEDAFCHILGCPDATAIELSHLPTEIESTIDAPLSALLLDAARREDEGRRDKIPVIETLSIGNHPTTRKQAFMADINVSVTRAKQIQGAIGAALVDFETGMCLGAQGDGRLNLELAAAGNAEVVRAKHRVMADLGISGGIQDILITLEEQLHLIRPIPRTNLFFYLAIDKRLGNLAIARHKLAEVEGTVKV